MTLKIPGVPTPLEGSAPVVIIGPNGVGKTRLGSAIASANDGERISALRAIELGGISMQTRQQAKNDLEMVTQQMTAAPWQQANDLQHLMADIVTENQDLAVAYREEHLKNPDLPLDKRLYVTRLTRIVGVWNRHFPGRSISISHQPTVVRTEIDGKASKYSLVRMSEGERTAFYLIARIVSCAKSVLIVDEPETYFHPLLARSLWDDLEREAPDVRFIYLTHDIPFALSRRNARFAIARSDSCAELLPDTSGIPSEVISDVLGAASFSILASRVIFCEGDLDLQVLRAWHNSPKTTVSAVGGCTAVRECVEAFRGEHVTAGLEAFGYVDRDAWPDEELESNQHVKALAVNEMEGIFCLERVFLALAKFNGAAGDQAAAQYAEFMAAARKQFAGSMFNRLVLERSKCRGETELRRLFNPIKNDADLSKVKESFSTAAPAGGWSDFLGTMFGQEEARLSASIAGPAAQFVRDFPAKSYFKLAAAHMKLVPERMVETLCTALMLTDQAAQQEQKLKTLRDELVAVLEPILWPRLV